MKKIIIIFLFLFLPVKSEIIEISGKHRHLGDISLNESCKIATERAKKNAIIQILGQTITSEVISKCSETEGEFDCERNQLSLFQLNGDITSYKEINRKDGKEIGSNVRFCEVIIKANVEPVKQNNDPNFYFNVKKNKKIFRSGEIIELEIDTSKKMYMAIFQWLPYGGKKYNKITKIFPNKEFNKNTEDLVNKKLNLEYEIYFPEEIKIDKVHEYLILVASEKKVNWLDEYTEIEGLKSQMSKTKILMEKHYSDYMIIR